MISLIDTHAHIVKDPLYSHVDEILRQAKAAHVNRILCICLNEIELERAFCLKEKYSMIDIAFGYHPTDLLDKSSQDWILLENVAKDKRIVAIGEIGLDYYWKEVEKDVQKDALRKQLQIALEVNKPILVHMREATKDILEIFKEYDNLRGIIHCFSGSYETAKQLVDMNFHISFAGPLTFKNARGLPEVVARLPHNRMFVETDCPYLTPHPYRGKENRPHYVQYTFQKMCEILNIQEEALSKIQWEQYHKLFSI